MNVENPGKGEFHSSYMSVNHNFRILKSGRNYHGAQGMHDIIMRIWYVKQRAKRKLKVLRKK